MKIEDYLKSNSNNSIKTYINKLIKRVLLTTIVILSILIVCNLNKNFKAFINENVYETNYNFSKINALYKKYFLDIKNNAEDKVTNLVNKNNILDYTETKEYKDGVLLSVSDKYPVKMLESGLIVFVGNREGINSVIVQQSNGIDVIYGNIDAKDIKVYDYIEKGTIIGETIENELYLAFYKDRKVLSYEPYIKY